MLYDFTSVVELERELCGALVRTCGGEPGWRRDGARFDQPTNMQRSGRLLVFSFAIKTPVVDEPLTILPYATATVPGVQVHTTVEMVFDDGSSSVAGIITAPPP